jgi:hypothetical protein
MEYETLLCEYVDYGRNKFIEVSKKRAISENAVFLNISKGYYTPDGRKQYRGGIGFPPEDAIVSGLIEKLQSMMGGAGEEGGGSSDLDD